MAKKRLIAYIIDMLILLIIGLLVLLLLPSNKIEVKLSNLNEQYLQSKITQEEYFREYIPISHEIDKENITFNVITTVMIIILFIVIPYCTKGQTIGLKTMKLKINSDKEINIEEYIGRCVILNGLGYSIIMLIILYITSDNVYFYLSNFLTFFQIIVVIISGFMVLYKKNHMGISDIITKTRIEEIK